MARTCLHELKERRQFVKAYANLHFVPGFRIHFSLMRIRIQLFTLMRIKIRIQLFILKRIRIQIQLFTLMRIRILLLIKVMQFCDLWPTDPPVLTFEPPRLHDSILSLESSWILSLMRIPIRFQLPKTMRIHVDSDPKPSLVTHTGTKKPRRWLASRHRKRRKL